MAKAKDNSCDGRVSRIRSVPWITFAGIATNCGTPVLCYVRTMATIKEAVRNASAFAVETLGPERAAGLQLEEVESTNVGGEDVWLITLSMIAPPQMATTLSAYLAEPNLDYKIFTVLKKKWRSHFHEDSGAGHDVMLDAAALITKHRSKARGGFLNLSGRRVLPPKTSTCFRDLSLGSAS
jgi:hypothetical protein